MLEAYSKRLIFQLTLGLTRCSQCTHGISMICTVARDELMFTRFSILMVVLTGNFERDFIGVRT
ncbi:hypothetical protein D3C85_1802170 [compost metagenome]